MVENFKERRKYIVGMSEKQRLSLNFNAKITPFEKLNEEFTVCKCYIHGLGKNRNYSYFDKEDVQKALDTLHFVPVVGHLYEDLDGNTYMGSHDCEWVLNDNGLSFKDLTVPFGVVPYPNNFQFEDVVENDGSTVTYLTGDIILWTGRYPALMEAVYDENTYFNQSMEVNVNYCEPLKEDKTYTKITDFSYSALCLLGKSDNEQYNKEPCFPSARVEAYNLNFSKDDFVVLMEEMQNNLSFHFETINKNNKGGNILEQNKDDKQFAKDTIEEQKEQEEQFENSIKIEQQTEDQIEQVEEVKDDEQLETDENVDIEKQDFQTEVEEHQEVKPTEAELKFSTYNEKRELVRKCLPKQDFVSYYVFDMDDDFVYVDREEYKNEYIITKGRFGYEIEDGNAKLTSDFEEIFVTLLTQKEKEAVENSRNFLEQELENLRQFKETTLKEQHKVDVDNLLGGFSDLEKYEEFEELKEKAYTFESLKDLEKECFAIRGMHMTVPADSGKANNSIKFSIKDTVNDDEPYGGLVSKFSKRK